MSVGVGAGARFTAQRPCPICGGHPGLARGKGVRCTGYYDDTGMYARCSREEYAGELLANGDEPPTFTHLLEGDCDCGTEHRPVPVSASKNGSKNGTKAEAKVIRRTRWKIYWYDGTYQATHLRLDYDDGNKSYPWEREDGTTGLNGTQPSGMLYGAELVNKHTLDIPVVLVEGEKCADALRGHKIRLSLATVTGASQRPVTFQLLDDAVLKPLVNRRIFLWPDADQNGQGRFHMDWVAAKLRELGCRDVRIVEWSNGGPKDDAADFCALYDEKAVRELLSNAPAYPGAPVVGGWKLESLPDGAGYRVSRDGYSLSVTNLRQTNTGPKGEAKVELQGEVLGARLELNSLSQRGGFATELRRYDKEVEWAKWLHGACHQILEAERGLEEPAIPLRTALGDLGTRDEEMLLHPLALDGLPAFIYGFDGTLKSYLAEAVALSLVTGQSLVAGFQPTCTMPVLYCDFELNRKVHVKRMKEILKLPWHAAEDRYPAEFHYMHCTGKGTISSQIDRIIREARRLRVGFVIFDSVSYAAEGPLSDDETARSYYQQIGRLGLPTMSIGHISKNAANPDFPFGSIFWRTSSRLAWFVEKVDSELDGTHIKLTNKKNTQGFPLDTLGLCFDFNDEGCSIKREQPGRHLPPVMRKLLDFLESRGEPATYAEIQLGTGVARGTLTPLARDFSDLLASLPGEGRYAKAKLGLRRWAPVEEPEAEGNGDDWESED